MVNETSGDGLSDHWRVLDVGTGEVVSEGDLGIKVSASVASPDGSAVAVAGNTGDVVTIDVATGDVQGDSPVSVPSFIRSLLRRW